MFKSDLERVPVTKKTWDKAQVQKRRVERANRPNHYNRIKTSQSQGHTWNRNLDYKTNIYFDCETFEYYQDSNDPKKLPLIVPYLIGACTDDPDSFTYFVGVDATNKFLDWLFNKVREVKYANLVAFNLDYDFHAIRPYLIDGYSDIISVCYEMSDNKKFNHGDITPVNARKDPIHIRFVDQWRWDTTKSLKTYLEHILSVTYKNGQPIGDTTSKTLHKMITDWGYTHETFKKVDDFDYHKVNVMDNGKELFYYPSRDDWLNNTNLQKLDLQSELKYLRNDVRSLPIIRMEQQLFRQTAMELLGIEDPIDIDNSITLPGFGKYLFEEKTKKYLTEHLRIGVSVNEYNSMLDSYVGAFVCGNRDITYLDEEVFKQRFPNRSFYDGDNNPIIKSYDVNSMYPWAMHTGLPYGMVEDFKPDGDSICWCEIQFLSETDPTNPDREWRLYKWKPQYDYLNNTFFGRHFSIGIVAGKTTCNRLFVPDFILTLFDEMCIADYKVVKKRYQRVTREQKDFIDILYRIKGDKSNPKSKIKCVKDILNSLYGKMAERFRETKVQWVSDTDAFVYKHRDLLDLEDVDIIDEETINKHSFKNNVAPYLDLTKKCGFFYVKNIDKRYDEDGNERREQITAGMYITWLSRWKLLSTVKNEIDQGNVILYCDTDSIKMIEFSEPKFEIDAAKLGAWKNEGHFTHFGHPNRHKKYFMYDAGWTEQDKHDQWMVKVSGINKRHLKGKDGKFDIGMIRTIYDPKNCVLVKNSRPDNRKNSLYQTVIAKTDFKFAFEDPKLEPTHILDGGVLTEL